MADKQERYPQGASVSRKSKGSIDQLERVMAQTGKMQQDEEFPASRHRVAETRELGESNPKADLLQDRVQFLAEIAMNERRKAGLMPQKEYADGGVVTPGASPSKWQQLYEYLTKSPLTKVTNMVNEAGKQGSPPPVTPPVSDISVVRKAAEEAGKRTEEGKKKKVPAYACGGVMGTYKRSR